ncbi:prepilin-type N-terminal cleavage/methylation domain-containing protein [candidate division KSB1 bacterium]|nr:prepilin-type N-terminal cleavage/methylation domain-containing protein [candidate division KSB1 bacterium]
MNPKYKNKGQMLIEVLIAIGIVAVLALIVTTTFKASCCPTFCRSNSIAGWPSTVVCWRRRILTSPTA